MRLDPIHFLCANFLIDVSELVHAEHDIDLLDLELATFLTKGFFIAELETVL